MLGVCILMNSVDKAYYKAWILLARFTFQLLIEKRKGFNQGKPLVAPDCVFHAYNIPSVARQYNIGGRGEGGGI